jgi:oxygen-independent coproporphyrinogen-3 oxidase
MTTSATRRPTMVPEVKLGPGVAAAPGIYVHVPFCARVCPYCDFAVQTGGPERRERFVGSLRREAELWGEHWRHDLPFDTVYLGGGTPSALRPEQLGAILETLRRSFPIDPEVRITLEANPEDVTPAAVAAWRRLGVTTLSLGVQSFDAEALRFLGRAHAPAQAIAAVETASAGGFETVSLDLIFGLPGRSDERWRADLRQATELRPQHVSCYELTIHEGTPFGARKQRGELVEAPEGRRADLFMLTHEALAGAGYEAYEVSNFAAAPQHRSRHNRKYWEHAPYLGIGPSSHSFDGVARRWWNHRRLSDWQRALRSQPLPIAGTETLKPADLVLEALALGLRTSAGIDLEALHRRHGIDLMTANSTRVAALEGAGLLTVYPPARLVPTFRGLAVADALAREFEIPPVD